MRFCLVASLCLLVFLVLLVFFVLFVCAKFFRKKKIGFKTALITPFILLLMSLLQRRPTFPSQLYGNIRAMSDSEAVRRHCGYWTQQKVKISIYKVMQLEPCKIMHNIGSLTWIWQINKSSTCEKKIYFQDQKDLWDFDILMVFLKTRSTTGEAFSQVVFSLNQKNRLNKMISYCSHVSV